MRDVSSETISTLTRLAPTEVELEIPLAAEEVEAAQQRAFGRLVRKVKMPGFRPGKVPRSLFEQTYGKGAIESEALEDLAPIAYERALHEHELDPIGSPEIRIMPREDGKPERLKAKVEVRPEFTLPEYRGVAVEVPAQQVSDEDVARSLAALARERATLVPVDRAARIGDVVTLDYEGRIGDVALEGASATGQQVELDEQRFIPGFASSVAGMRAGETKRFDLTFPLEYAHRESAGKSATFAVTVHEVKEVELPALDDDFAKAASDCETIDALRSELRRRLEMVADARRRRAVANAVMERLVGGTDIPVPSGLLERELESMVTEAREAEGEPSEEMRARYRRDAAARVRGTFLLEAIAKTEAVEATPDEVREEVESLARRYGVPPDRMRRALRERMDSIKSGIVRTKTLDLLVDSAVVVDPSVRDS
jgi:trigger factor